MTPPFALPPFDFPLPVYIRRAESKMLLPQMAILPGLMMPPGLMGGGLDFDPATLADIAAVWDISDMSTLFEDISSSPSTPAIVDGRVGTVLDKSGNGRHLLAYTGGVDQRATLRRSGDLYWLEFSNNAYDHSLPSAKYSVAVAIRQTSGVTGFRGLFATGEMVLLAQTPSPGWGTYSSGTTYAGSNIADAQDHVIVMEGINSGTFYLDGVNDGSWAATSGQVRHIGGIENQRYNGRFYGAVVRSVPFGQDRKNVEKWLAIRQGRKL